VPTIFLSYRRDDTKAITWEISKRLKRRYGDKQVIMDVDAIPIGSNYREYIRVQLAECNALVVIIGKHWLSRNDKGELRIAEQTDWVRLEIEAALARNIPVIPLKVDGGVLPEASELPESVRPFVDRQATDLESGPHFDSLIDNFVKLLDAHITSRTKLTLAQLFFSLDGRINRAKFWVGFGIWVLVLLVASVTAAFTALLLQIDLGATSVRSVLGLLGLIIATNQGNGLSLPSFHCSSAATFRVSGFTEFRKTQLPLKRPSQQFSLS
jgi:hypothetical protein